MKVLLRKRYYCDYCKRAGGSRVHMEKHEKGCTNNPKRECGIRREPAPAEVVLVAGGANRRYAHKALQRQIQAGRVEAVLRLTKRGRAFLRENGG